MVWKAADAAFQTPTESYQGIVRLVYLRPISVASGLAVPIITPSLSWSMMSFGFIEFRKKTLWALQAARTLARA